LPRRPACTAAFAAFRRPMALMCGPSPWRDKQNGTMGPPAPLLWRRRRRRFDRRWRRARRRRGGGRRLRRLSPVCAWKWARLVGVVGWPPRALLPFLYNKSLLCRVCSVAHVCTARESSTMKTPDARIITLVRSWHEAAHVALRRTRPRGTAAVVDGDRARPCVAGQ